MLPKVVQPIPGIANTGTSILFPLRSLCEPVGTRKVRSRKMIAQQENTDNNRTVIVAGAHGVAGRAALEHYATLPGTVVYGLSRRSAPRSGKIHHIDRKSTRLN